LDQKSPPDKIDLVVTKGGGGLSMDKESVPYHENDSTGSAGLNIKNQKGFKVGTVVI
jgi:hypothetical protein